MNKGPLSVQNGQNNDHNHHHGPGIVDNREASRVKENNVLNNKKRKELDGYVGFANLPNQVYRKAVKKGFNFTLMVVGKTFSTKSFYDFGKIWIIFQDLFCLCRRVWTGKVNFSQFHVPS